MSLFITFEGCEGSGKSTQAKLVCEKLKQQEKNVILSREPGGTTLAEEIRSLLLNTNEIADPLTEFLLISAARRDHVEKLIKPALKKGTIVICDRFFDSSFAYQGYAKGLDLKVMERILQISIDDFKPDLTFVMDIDPKIAINRISGKRKSNNHYDNKDQEFHIQIRNAFLELAKKHHSRTIVIDSMQKINSIHEDIMSAINKKLKKQQ